MKAIYFSDRLRDSEEVGSRPNATASTGARPSGPPSTIVGSDVYRATLLRALLKYGTYDRIFVAPHAAYPERSLRDVPLFRDNSDRMKELYEYQLERLQDYEPCVFLTSTTHLDRLSRLRRVSRCEKVSITGTIHSLNYATTLKIFLSHMLAPLDRRDALICSSTAGKTVVKRILDLVSNRLQEGGWPKLTSKYHLPVIPLGVEVSDYENAIAGDIRSTLGIGPGPLVLYFGRFSNRSKGDLQPLILAFSRLSQAHPDATLVLAGDDTQFHMSGLLREFADSVAPQSNIRIVPSPNIETKRRLYAAADVFVSPSDSLQETFGITIIEAMAAGLPAVVSDWNGYRDLVEDGVTGFRVPTLMPHYAPRFDDLRGTGEMLRPDVLAATTMVSVSGMADALRVLVADPERRRTMGDAARRRARSTFDWRVIIGAYEALWAELALESSRARPASPTAGVDLEQFGYREVFDHYATGHLTSDAIVRISALGEEWRSCTEWLAKTADVAPLFQRQVFEGLIEVLRGSEGLAMSEVMSRVPMEDDEDFVWRTAHLCRLIKYGVVESVSEAGPADRAAELDLPAELAAAK